MAEVNKVQERMKADMEIMNEQIATMMEAMMSMKKIMKVNAAVVATVSTVFGVDPTPPYGLNQINHPTSDMVCLEGKELGGTGSPYLVRKTSMPSHHMTCLQTVHHPMWHTLPVKMSITPLPYSLKADNPKLIMHMSLKPWGRHMKCPTTI